MEKRQLAADVLKALGGAGNLIETRYCASRIRVTVRDSASLDRAALEALAAVKAVLELGRAQHGTEYHLVVGPGNSRSLYQALTELIGQQ
ncbi:PTS transporter subunit EIIB [Erwiniaceae bacterium CAU 1747]